MNRYRFFKKKLLIVFALLIVISFIIILVNKKNLFNTDIKPNESESYLIELNEIKLNDYVKNFYNNKNQIDIIYIQNSLIFGEILDVTQNGDLFSTIALFKYDLKTEDFELYDYKDRKRIWQYSIIGDSIYYITLTGNEDSYFTWELFKSDINFDNSKSVIKGDTRNPLFSTEFIRGNNNELFLVTVDEDLNSQALDDSGNFISDFQEFNIYLIRDMELKKIRTGKGNIRTQKGQFLCDLLNLSFDNNKITYCLITDYEKQEVILLDVKSFKEETLFTNNSNDLNINSFINLEDGLFINMNSPLDAMKGQTIKYKKYDKSDNVSTLESNLTTSDKGRVLKNKVLIQSALGWYLYDASANILKSVDFPSIYVYPFFSVIDENTIIVQNDEQKYFIGTIESD